MRIQRVLLWVRAESVQVFSQGEMGFVTFFRRGTTPFAIRPLFPKDIWCTTRETALRTSSEDRRWLRATFQCLRCRSNQWRFFTRVEVDLTRCEGTSLARPQEPTTSIQCGTPRLLSVNSILLSKNMLRRKMARHGEHCALIVL